jgi:methyl-accepting chemotaxis protein
MKLTIEFRLLVTLTLLALLLMVTGVLGIAGMHGSNKAVGQAYPSDVAAVTALGKSNLNLTVVRTTLDRVLLHPEASDTAALVNKAPDYLAGSNAAWKESRTLPVSEDEAALSKAVADAREALLRGALEPMVNAMRHGDQERADHIAMVDMPPPAATLTNKTEAFNKFRNLQGSGRYKAAQERHGNRAVSLVDNMSQQNAALVEEAAAAASLKEQTELLKAAASRFRLASMS